MVYAKLSSPDGVGAHGVAYADPAKDKELLGF
jgi:hypothetical protein